MGYKYPAISLSPFEDISSMYEQVWQAVNTLPDNKKFSKFLRRNFFPQKNTDGKTFTLDLHIHFCFILEFTVSGTLESTL